MAGKIKLTVTVDRDLAQELDIEAKSLNSSRSALVEKAIRLLKHKRVEESLKAGYQAMADENVRVAEELVHYAPEALDGE